MENPTHGCTWRHCECSISPAERTCVRASLWRHSPHLMASGTFGMTLLSAMYVIAYQKVHACSWCRMLQYNLTYGNSETRWLSDLSVMLTKILSGCFGVAA